MPDIKTFVEFFYRGLLFDEYSVREVPDRNIDNLTVPEGAFGFRFFDVMTTQEKGVKMESDRLNVSPMYYYGGRLLDLSQVLQEMPKDRTLIANMRINNWYYVIKCRTGNFKPFLKGDILIEVGSQSLLTN